MYGSAERKTVQGWLSEIDARIFELLLSSQSSLGLNGSVAEIGLHHGKSFILMCSFLQPTENAYGIDVFESQDLNLDSSGSGNKQALIGHLQRFECDLSKVILDCRLSGNVRASDVTNSVGEIRFFSIDGGHWYSTVQSDLDLARECLVSGGVIAIDDYLRSEWPEVGRAFHVWYEANKEEFAIIAIGFNKVYLSHKSWVTRYQEELIEDEYMHHMLSKYYKIEGVDIPVYSIFFLPEMKKRERLVNFFKMYYPDKFIKYRVYNNRVVFFRRNLTIKFPKIFAIYKYVRGCLRSKN
jgi:hypothetical protein